MGKGAELNTKIILNGKVNPSLQKAFDKANKLSTKTMDKLADVGKKTAQIGAAAAVATGAVIGKIAKDSISAYAEYEQLAGGIDTLFKKASDKVMNYATNAYKTAGLSTNQYMETVTSFSASLLQSLSGNADKAAKIADMAVTDMADNSNKMGTQMDMIIQTYQSLARGNYAMLDNLKLGFGGTKKEMQRLLEEAEKLSGLKFDISSYADVVRAIHVIQEEMGITGTTALEAATTIQGSAASMKASWQNVLVAFADPKQNLDEVFNRFIDSVVIFGNNLIPRIQAVLPRIATGISQLATALATHLPSIIQTLLPALIQGTVQVVGSLIQNLPKILKSIVTAIGTTLKGYASQLKGNGGELLKKLGDGLVENLPTLINKGLELLTSFSGSLRENAGLLVNAGLGLILKLAEGLMNSLPTLIAKVPTIVSNIAGIINDNAPKLIVAAGKLIVTLAKGLINAIPTIAANIPQIIKAIVDVFLAFNWMNLGKKIITGLKNGFVGENPVIVNAAKKILTSIVNVIKQLPMKLWTWGKTAISKLASILRNTASLRTAANAIVTEIARVIGKLPGKMLSIGKNLVKGLWNGIVSVKDWVLGKIKGFGESILAGIRGVFDMNSPSKVTTLYGKFAGQGIGIGVEKSTRWVQKKVGKFSEAVKSKMASIKTKVEPVVSKIKKKKPKLPKFGRGGTLTSPMQAIVGDKPETIVPHGNKPRNRALLQEAARGVGVGTGGNILNFTFAPIINGGGSVEDNRKMLQEEEAEFERKMDAYFAKKGRLAF